MKFGVFLPISGRASGPDTLMEAAHSAGHTNGNSTPAGRKTPRTVANHNTAIPAEPNSIGQRASSVVRTGSVNSRRG